MNSKPIPYSHYHINCICEEYIPTQENATLLYRLISSGLPIVVNAKTIKLDEDGDYLIETDAIIGSRVTNKWRKISLDRLEVLSNGEWKEIILKAADSFGYDVWKGAGI